MKYIIFLSLFFTALSCSNDFDLVAPHVETPVIYGLLNANDTAQYIRVERTFVDKNTSANIIAQNPDSLYYEGITVSLTRVATGDTWTLTRVDGNNEGLQREEGVFATAPNFLYKIRTADMDLVTEEDYEIRIDGVFEDRTVSATTDVIEQPFLSMPQNESFIAFDRNRAVNIGWNPRGDLTIYAVTYIFSVDETMDGITKERILEWNVETATEKTNVEFLGLEFYSFLAGALEQNPSITRRMNRASFRLVAGNNDLKDYLRVTQANLGITSSGEIPVFTNIENGLGIFGSRSTEIRERLGFRDTTIDSLVNSPITSALNFQF